ncbi:unnamed protein product [Moneuplotes crassus]|uniref:Uncharacterized protein n=1 Tax=Euplotes crassus TaxID=5936 RepID=A0AAD2CWQ5_EUPCR|nr:unnamed protein product [Moneuplotes crassus]
MAGIDPSLVLVEEDKELNRFLYCAICLMVVNDPTQCSQCQSSFCQECIDKWRFANSNRCPHKCEGKLKLEKVHKIVKNMLDDLQIRCQYHNDGCESILTGDPVVRNKHYLECEFAKIQCKNSQCEVITTRGKMAEHSLVCEYRTQKCTKGCSKILRITEVEDHNCISALEDLIIELREECKERTEEVLECKEEIKALKAEVAVQKYIHEDIKCDGCKMSSIKTDRFCCNTCDSYNLCLFCYCRNSHKQHNFTIYGALGVLILHESKTPEKVNPDQIMKKEIFLKNVGDKIEITVFPYKQPRPLQEFKSTFSTINTNESGSVYFHFQVPSEVGVYENQFRFFCNKRHEKFGSIIKIKYEVVEP